MAGKAKYDPLEAAKLGTTPAPAPAADAVAPAADVDLDVDVDAAPPPPRRPRYELKADTRVSINGNQHNWKAGRIVDSAGYDVEKLKDQGVPLELIKE